MTFQTFTDLGVEYTYFINEEKEVCLGTEKNTQSAISREIEGPLHVPGIFYKENIKIEVKIIGVWCFYSVKVSEIYLPSTIKMIKNGAFESASNLKIVDLSKTKAQTLYGFQFSGSVNLETIHLPPKLSVIGNYTFQRCSKLKDLVLPSTIKRIDVLAFSKAAIERIIFCGTSDIKGSLNTNISSIIVPNNYNGDSFCGSNPVSRQTFYCSFDNNRRKTLYYKRNIFNRMIFFCIFFI